MESGEPLSAATPPGLDVLAAAVKHRMFTPGDKVVVAVSGGADSVAMLHALHSRADEFGITLHVAHLNHGIRGEESDADEAFVRQLARRLALPITARRVSVPEVRAEMGGGEEEAARAVRYKFLLETATAVGAAKIAVGHTADDRAETVLLNILRGTGVDGLGSIRPVKGNIVRPLIDTWRREVEEYVTQHALEYRIDCSNLDTRYTRNRVRHELLPLLERDYNPQLRAALVRLAEIAASQSDLMNRLAAAAAVGAECGSGLDARLISELPEALLLQVVRAEVERAKGDLTDVTHEQVLRVVSALTTGEDFTITLPTGRIYAELAGGNFRVRSCEEPPDVVPFDRPMAVPGITTIPEIGVSISAEIVEGTPLAQTPPDTALIDAGAIRGPLRARSIRPGDRIRPLGMAGSKKLQDVFVDKKIPRSERARAVVVVDDVNLLWVAGVVLAETARLTLDTRLAIRLVMQ